MDVACQAARRALTAQGFPQAAACARTALPVTVAILSVAAAIKAVYDAGQDGATIEMKKEAVASCCEAIAGAASTYAVTACGASATVGLGILGVGLFAGWCVRKFDDSTAMSSSESLRQLKQGGYLS